MSGISVTVQDGSERRAVTVATSVARIGRSPECEVQLPSDPTVSRVHAVLRRDGDRLSLEDVASRNGTFVNGERVSGVVGVTPADRIRVGPFVIVAQDDDAVHLETADASETPSRLRLLTGLSDREIEVLRLVARGHGDQQIAEALVLSVKTVQSHLDRIRDKTGRRRRPDLLRYAIDHASPEGEPTADADGPDGLRQQPFARLGPDSDRRIHVPVELGSVPRRRGWAVFLGAFVRALLVTALAAGAAVVSWWLVR